MGNRVLAMDNLSWFGESSIITLCCYFVILLFCLFLLLGNIYKYITRGFCKYVLRLLRSTYTIVAHFNPGSLDPEPGKVLLPRNWPV